MKTQPRAFVMLYVVIVVASITVGMALAASLGSTFAGNRIRADQQQAQLRAFTMKCADTVLLFVRSNVAVSLTATYAVGAVGSVNYANCSYSISGTAPVKTITLTATQYNLYKRVTIVTSQVAPTLVTTWTESN